MNELAHPLEATYEKRARQLVKKGRALWIAEGKICLLEPAGTVMDLGTQKQSEQHEEAKQAMDSTYEAGKSNDGYRVVDEGTFDTGRFYDEEQLYHLAKKKLAAKRALVLHAASYAVVNVFLFFLFAALVVSGDMDGGEAMTSFVGVAGGWGIGLTMHTISYFTRATPERIEREYQKLKDLAKKGL